MNSRQIESWALRIIDCVSKGQPNEDFLVELKREWIEPVKAARQIAGHSNFARGENILWLIGVDEKQGVIGVDATDIADWYPAVESHFDELAPRITPLNIPIKEKTVVALLFDTDRAPYIIKNPQYGQTKGFKAKFEVPWKEGTRTRTACRADLIRLLSPLESLPDIEILDIDLIATVKGIDSHGNPVGGLRLTSDLYIVPTNKERLVLPFHKCQVQFRIGEMPNFEADRVIIDSAAGERSLPFGLANDIPGSLTIARTAHEVIIDGPGRVSLKAQSWTHIPEKDYTGLDITISISLLPTGINLPFVLTKTLIYPEPLLEK